MFLMLSSVLCEECCGVLGYNKIESLSERIDILMARLCRSCIMDDYGCLNNKPKFIKLKEGLIYITPRPKRTPHMAKQNED